MRLITVRTISIATLSALAGIGTAVALVKVSVTPGVSPGIEASPGTFTGRVTDVATGIALENAMVLLEGAGIGAVTSEEGRFILSNVPAGRHTVTLKSMGYAEKKYEVTVTQGQTTVTDLEMMMQPVRLRNVVITVESPDRSSR